MQGCWHVLLPGTLLWGQERLPLFDLGADDSFIDERLAEQAGLRLEPLTEPKQVLGLDGRVLVRVTHRTALLGLLVSGNHREMIRLFLIPSSSSPAILGSPWLSLHNPQIDWSAGAITGWNVACRSRCLRSALPPSSPRPADSSGKVDLASVPKAYHDLGEVFSKQWAQALPPHRPYNCTIDLQPGAPLPTSHFYNLSKPEREALKQNLSESLASGLVHPSSSPVGAGFFFVKKKDGSLRPCIDYHVLNQITSRNRYPLPLMDAAFAPLQRVRVFSKTCGSRTTSFVSWRATNGRWRLILLWVTTSIL